MLTCAELCVTTLIGRTKVLFRLKSIPGAWPLGAVAWG